MSTAHKAAIATTLGSISALHSALKNLEVDGVDGLDPAICSLEDAFGALDEVLTGEPSVVAFARTR